MAAAQTTLCGLAADDFYIRMEEFHGGRSPGMVVGALMIDTALTELGPTPYLNVVTETVVCLPDAVQLLTPCTMGNGFLQVLDWAKFALTAYDRQSLAGLRVWLDSEAVTGYPLIRRWFERTPEGGEKPAFDDLAPEIIAAGRAILDWRPVRLPRALKVSGRIATGPCPRCGESYALHLGPACPACQGEAYYEL